MTDPEVIAPEDLAAYVADLSGELSILAAKSGQHHLGYLLGLVKTEAMNLTKQAESDPDMIACLRH